MAVFLVVGSLAAYAEEHGEPGTAEKPAVEVPQWLRNIRLSGYGMVQYQTTYEDEYDEDDSESSTFNLRFMRLILDGKIGDFDWRTQIQGTNVRGAGEPTVQLLDLYAEWTRYKELRIRAGQFQRPFSFESTIHPISQGWGTGVIGSRTVDYRLGDKADGWYALGMVPVIKNKLQVKARYQTYRVSKEWGTSKSLYEVGVNYFITKNLQLNFEYARLNDRTRDKHNYNLMDVQLDFRF